MTMINRKMEMSGTLSAKVIRNRPSWRWRLKNTLRWGFIKGWLAYYLANIFSKITGIVTIRSTLSIVVFHNDGRLPTNYGVVGYRCITDVGVAFLVDDWHDGSEEIGNMNYHGCGIGSGAESQTETALVSECTTVLNPDSTRATGTKSQPSANILRSVGTLSFDGSAAVIEHGLFDQAATGGGVLWDRTLFSVVNVGSGDSIQFTYNCTLSAGS